MKIVIFGLGYVGTVSAACLADLGHEVIGTDINPVKMGIINQKKAPLLKRASMNWLKKWYPRAGCMPPTILKMRSPAQKWL